MKNSSDNKYKIGTYLCAYFVPNFGVGSSCLCLTAWPSYGDWEDLDLGAPELMSVALKHNSWEESPVPLRKMEDSRGCAPRFEPVVKAWAKETSTPTTERLLTTGPSLPSGKSKEESLEESTCCTTSPALLEFDCLDSDLAMAAKAFDQSKPNKLCRDCPVNKPCMQNRENDCPIPKGIVHRLSLPYLNTAASWNFQSKLWNKNSKVK